MHLPLWMNWLHNDLSDVPLSFRVLNRCYFYYSPRVSYSVAMVNPCPWHQGQTTTTPMFINCTSLSFWGGINCNLKVYIRVVSSPLTVIVSSSLHGNLHVVTGKACRPHFNDRLLVLSSHLIYTIHHFVAFRDLKPACPAVFYKLRFYQSTSYWGRL